MVSFRYKVLYRLKGIRFTIGKKYGAVFAFILSLFLVTSIITTLSMNGLISFSKEVEKKSDTTLQVMDLGSIFKQKYIIISDILTEQSPKMTIEEYNVEVERFQQLVKEIEPRLESTEAQKVFKKVLVFNDQIDELFHNTIIPTTAEYRDNHERVPIFVQTDLQNKATVLRNYTISELDTIREILSFSDRRPPLQGL